MCVSANLTSSRYWGEREREGERGSERRGEGERRGVREKEREKRREKGRGVERDKSKIGRERRGREKKERGREGGREKARVRRRERAPELIAVSPKLQSEADGPASPAHSSSPRVSPTASSRICTRREDAPSCAGFDVVFAGRSVDFQPRQPRAGSFANNP